ncbi:MAG: PP2C family protein-serine/threonine phosphatase [Anaerolineae bacterium]
MPFYFWFGLGANTVTVTVASAAFLIVIWLGPRRRVNLSFALFLLALIVWNGASNLLRLLVFMPALGVDPQPWLEIGTAGFGWKGITLFLFVLNFYRIKRRLLWVLAAIGVAIHLGAMVLLFNGQLIAHPQAMPDGQVGFVTLPVGYLLSGLIFIYELLALGVLITRPNWSEYWHLFVGTLIILVSGVAAVAGVTLIPILTIGSVLGALLMTYAVVKQQLFNPLLELNRRLEEQVARRTAELRRSLADQERIRSELKVAREIQTGFLPDITPHLPGFQVFGCSLPAEEVGGDFFSYRPLPYQRLSIAVGDVSGKGVPAALLMALSINAFETLAPAHHDQGRLLRALDEVLAPRLSSNKANTALLAILLDGMRREARIANAGLVFPLLWRAGQARYIDNAGFPLGVMAEADYRETVLSLQAGDRLLIVSDGVVEAMNADREMFGFARLEATLRANGDRDPKALSQLILETVQAHTHPAAAHDDMTLVVIGVT